MRGVASELPDIGCLSAAVAVGIAEGLSKFPLRFRQEWLIESNSTRCLVPRNESALGDCYAGSPLHILDNAQFSNLTGVIFDISHDVYAYEFHGTTVYLAFVILLLHVVTVMIHLCVIYFGDCWSSSAWSTHGELLVLAQQSPPSKHLENTSGGVRSSKTWRLRVSVKDLPGDNKAGMVIERAEHVDETETQTKLRADWKYS